MDPGILVLIILVSFFVVMLLCSILPTYIKVRTAGAKITLGYVFGMRFRKTDPKKITKPLIRVTNAGLYLPIRIIEQHYLAGGNIDKVIDAMIAAKEYDIPLNYKMAMAFDFSGADMVDLVNYLTAQRKLFTETELRQVIRAYLESLDQDVLAVNRMAQRSRGRG